jgi:hypothetical protein
MGRRRGGEGEEKGGRNQSGIMFRRISTIILMKLIT